MSNSLRAFALQLVNFPQTPPLKTHFSGAFHGFRPAHTLRRERCGLPSGPSPKVMGGERTMSNHDEAESHELPNASRRTFCADVLLTSAGLVLAAPGLSKAAPTQGSVAAFPPRKIEGAERLLPGGSLYFYYPTTSDPAVLLRGSDGEYRAYSRRCSHAGCSVEFDPGSRCLRCPCHQGTFDARMGHVMYGPPRRPLDEIILQVRAGGYLWATGKSFGREGEVITQVLGGGD